MGADMLVAYVTIGAKKKPNFEKGFTLIAKLRATHSKDWPKEYVDATGDDEIDRITQAGILEGDLKDLMDAYSGCHRHAASITVAGREVILTGGLSWGDVPTDLYSALDRLLLSGAAKACGFRQ